MAKQIRNWDRDFIPRPLIPPSFETVRCAARTPWDSCEPEGLTLNKALHIDHLRDQVKGLREKANDLPAGEERDMLLRQAKQDEIALRLIEWINSPGRLPPPENLVPIRRHRLRPK